MGMRLSPLVLVGLSGRLGLRGVLLYGELFLLGSGRLFGMLVGLGFIVGSLAAMLVAVGSVLMCIGPMFMSRFLVAIIGRAACC
jgi:hypothetical protein